MPKELGEAEFVWITVEEEGQCMLSMGHVMKCQNSTVWTSALNALESLCWVPSRAAGHLVISSTLNRKKVGKLDNGYLILGRVVRA